MSPSARHMRAGVGFSELAGSREAGADAAQAALEQGSLDACDLALLFATAQPARARHVPARGTAGWLADRPWRACGAVSTAAARLIVPGPTESGCWSSGYWADLARGHDRAANRSQSPFAGAAAPGRGQLHDHKHPALAGSRRWTIRSDSAHSHVGVERVRHQWRPLPLGTGHGDYFGLGSHLLLRRRWLRRGRRGHGRDARLAHHRRFAPGWTPHGGSVALPSRGPLARRLRRDHRRGRARPALTGHPAQVIATRHPPSGSHEGIQRCAELGEVALREIDLKAATVQREGHRRDGVRPIEIVNQSSQDVLCQRHSIHANQQILQGDHTGDGMPPEAAHADRTT